MIYKPYPYQEYAERFILEHKAAGLFLDMGLGKTAIALSAAEKLLRDSFEVDCVLVIAPLLPAKETWPSELQKWDHLEGLTHSLIIGSATERRSALNSAADIYIVNRENVSWLVQELHDRKIAWPFDMVIIDELSSFKSSKSQRWRELRKVRKYIKRIVGLTGTPAPNGLLDLWPEIYLLDQGQRLGRTVTGYKEKYFIPGRRGPSGIVYNWEPRDTAKDEIFNQLTDLCISMTTGDYVQLPDRFYIRQNTALGPKAMAQYKQLKRDLFLPLKNADIDAATAAILTNKLLQLASGAVYDDMKVAHLVHTAKLDKLDQLLEEANGQPVLVFYNYRHELDNILSRHPEAVLVKTEGAVEKWNAGKIPLLLANPASAGHGLNLQFGGHIIIWFSPTWNLEFYQQANKRLHRRGQTEPVLIHNIVASGTIDERVYDIALTNKEKLQNELIDLIKATIEEE